MSSNLENNKIFAAILVAGITAMLAGFIAEQLVHSETPEEEAYPIEAIEVSAGGEVVEETGPEPIADLLATADIARGESLSKACAACHSFNQGGPNKIGPNLWNVVNGPKAHLDSFAYSSAMEEKGGVWDYEALNAFLWKPKKFIPGTKMNYIGLKKPEDRAAVIKWLETLK